MTIEELTKSYVSKEKYEKVALEGLLYIHLSGCDAATIQRILYRAGITSIKELNEANENQIKRVRNCGEKRFKQIMTLKEIINKELEGE